MMCESIESTISLTPTEQPPKTSNHGNSNNLYFCGNFPVNVVHVVVICVDEKIIMITNNTELNE
jgi:hypothetical protein